MEQFSLDLKDINNEDSAKVAAQILIQSIRQANVFPQNLVKDFFNKCYNNMENTQLSPQIRFHNLLILKYIAYKDKYTVKIVSTFSSHPLYAYLVDLASKVDPKKSISQKGKNFFPSNRQLGNAFIRLTLQLIIKMAQIFPENNQHKPTKFKRTYAALIDDNIVMPKDYIFFRSQKKSETNIIKKKEPIQKSQTPQPKRQSNNAVSSSGSKYASQIQFLFNKMEILVDKMEDDDTEDGEIQREVSSCHIMFEKDLEKFQSLSEQIMDNQSPEIVTLYFNVCQFMQKQNQIYKEYIPKSDYQSYVTIFLNNFYSVFPSETSDRKKKQPLPVKKTQKTSRQEGSALGNIKKTVSKVQTNEYIKPDVTSTSILQKKNPYQPKNEYKIAKNRDNSYLGNNLLVNFFSRLETKSKSPAGFKLVKDSLEKQKKQIHVHPPRGKSPNASHYGKSSKFSVNSMMKSAIKVNGIFANPPNPVLAPKSYQGELVIENTELEKILYEIKKDQGVRKFKVSNFREKYPLFENQNIQIGFKSEQVYEKVDKYNSIIGIQLYIGNKSENKIDNFELYFQGDKNSLLYTNPQNISKEIYPGDQIRIQLMIIPKMIPFNFINMRIAYKVSQSIYRTSAVLPNSILKLSTFINLTVEQFKSDWSKACKRYLKTEPFKLSRFFPPNNFQSYIKQLTAITKYADFSLDGSTTDYELMCSIFVEEQFQGLLKINIRPDLTVILQLGIFDEDEKCVQTFKFFLQSLELIMKETQM